MSEENEEGLFVDKQGKKCSWRLKKKDIWSKKKEWEERWEREFQMPHGKKPIVWWPTNESSRPKIIPTPS